jgi:hypothetical protein
MSLQPMCETLILHDLAQDERTLEPYHCKSAALRHRRLPAKRNVPKQT